MYHSMDGHPSLGCPTPRGVQELLVASEPERCFVPRYLGRHGRVGHWLDIENNWDEVAGLIEESYRMTAPKRLVAQLPPR